MRPGSPRRSWILATSFVAWIVGSCYAADAIAEPKNAAGTTPVRAPMFSLPSRSDEPVCLDSLQAKIVLVDFWASWCVPCRRSFPWMNALRDKYGAKGLVIVAVNVDKERAAAEKFLVVNPASFTIAFDPAGKTAEAFHVSAMPSSYLIARDGRILFQHQGFDPKKTVDLETRIAEECSR